MNRISTLWIVRGIASVVFGALTIAAPAASIAAIVFLYGTFALLEGVASLGFGISAEPGRRAPLVVRGIFGVAAGLVALMVPDLTALALYALVGAWAVASGAAELGVAWAIHRAVHVGPLVVAGALSIAFGVLMLALPALGVIALLGVLAGWAITSGITLIVAGASAHRLETKAAHAV